MAKLFNICKYLFLFIVWFNISFLFGQPTFRKMPFDKAQEMAKKENRILMVQLTSKDCIQCNEVAEKGLGSASVKSKIFEEKIIAVQYSFGESDWDQITKKYNAPRGLAI
ncbi:MAG: hypothetical protein ACRC2O_16025, partial [Chitinophagaceae bacterium]